jgi:hypothetical protein
MLLFSGEKERKREKNGAIEVFRLSIYGGVTSPLLFPYGLVVDIKMVGWD